MKWNRCIATGLIAAFLIAPASAQKSDRAEVLFESARQKEMLEGNLESAIKQYKEVVAKYGSNRAVAAKALVRMGECYDKLGDTEARKAYERVVREFGDQKEAVEEARKHLGTKDGSAETGVIARRVEKVEGSYESISKDGRYAALRRGILDGIPSQILVHDLVTGEMRPLVTAKSGDEAFMDPLISPDGTQVVYTANGKQAYVIGVSGSNPRLLLTTGWVNAYAWSPDGKHLLVSSYEDGAESFKRILLSVADGSRRVIGTGNMGGAGFSPDGSYFAFVKYVDSGSDIFLQSVNGRPEIPLVRNAGHATRPTFTPDGKRLLFLSDRGGTRDLWSIPLVNGAPGGPPELVKQKARILLGITSAGDCYYLTTSLTADVYVAGVDVQTHKITSQPSQVTSRHVNFGPSWSPDGEYLAYAAWFGMPENPFPLKVMIRSMKTGEDRELAPKEPSSLYCERPQWFPDSRSLLLESWNDGRLRRIDVRTSEGQLLPEGPKPVHGGNFEGREPVILSPDGRTIYYKDPKSNARETRILRRDLGGGPVTEVCRVTADFVGSLSVSPDGGRLMFQVNSYGGGEAGGKRSFAIMMVAASGGEPREVYRTSSPRILHPAWSSDGRHVLFVRELGTAAHRENELYAIPAEGGEPRPFGLGPMHDVQSPAVSPDGKRIAFVDKAVDQQLWVLKNLFADAKGSR